MSDETKTREEIARAIEPYLRIYTLTGSTVSGHDGDTGPLVDYIEALGVKREEQIALADELARAVETYIDHRLGGTSERAKKGWTHREYRLHETFTRYTAVRRIRQ